MVYGELMTKSQIINVIVSGDNKVLELYSGIEYQMLIDSFGSICFINVKTGNYLPISLKEVKHCSNQD